MMSRPSDQRPVGLPGKVSPYGRRAAGRVGPTGSTRTKFPVSEIESPNWYTDRTGHIILLVATAARMEIEKFIKQKNKAKPMIQWMYPHFFQHYLMHLKLLIQK